MKRILFLLLILPLCVLGQDLEVLRLEYPTATLDSHTAEALSKSLDNISEKDEAVFLAYKGALLTIRAKFTGAIKDKKQYFKEGVSFLEFAINAEPDNIEIRCIRLGVQENSPKIVKYKTHISEDKEFLLANYSGLTDKDIRAFIKGFVVNSTSFNDSEKQLF